MRSERHMGQQIVDQLYLAASQKRAKPGHVRLIKLITKRPTNKPTAASLWAKYEAWDTLPNIVPPEGYVCVPLPAGRISRGTCLTGESCSS